MSSTRVILQLTSQHVHILQLLQLQNLKLWKIVCFRRFIYDDFLAQQQQFDEIQNAKQQYGAKINRLTKKLIEMNAQRVEEASKVYNLILNGI